MSAASAFLALIAALPDLIKLGQEFMKFLNHASGGDAQGYVKNLGDAFATLNAAKTPEERQNAAQKIAKAIGSMP